MTTKDFLPKKSNLIKINDEMAKTKLQTPKLSREGKPFEKLMTQSLAFCFVLPKGHKKLPTVLVSVTLSVTLADITLVALWLE